MRILITGKNSYIGNSFKGFLKAKLNHHIEELSVKDENWKNKSFKNYDVIIHLAALVHKNERKYTLKDYEKVNVELTLDIAKKAIKEGVSKFIFFSTMAVFGKVKVINNISSLNPVTKYGITKLKAEQSLDFLVKGSNMVLTIIRPPMIYGLGAKGNPSLIEKLSRLSPIFPETLNKRSFLSIENLNQFLFKEIHNKQAKTIHPKDPNLLSTFKLFEYYRAKLNKKAYPMKFLGFLLKKLTFISFVDKIFGDLYYDFNDKMI